VSNTLATDVRGVGHRGSADAEARWRSLERTDVPEKPPRVMCWHRLVRSRGPIARSPPRDNSAIERVGSPCVRGPTLVIIALVLVSAFLHALWNAMLRLETDKARSLVAAIVIATAIAVAIAGIRWGLGAAPFASLAGAGATVLAGALEAAYFATLARAMQRGTLGVVYTISRGGAVLAVWPLSIALFAEHPTPTAIAGSLIVLTGLALSGLGAGNATRRIARGSTSWAIACALSIAGYHLAYKAALSEGTNPSACFALALAISATIHVTRLGRPGRAQVTALMRERGPRLLAMGLACSASFLVLVEALAIGGSGYVLTLRNTSVLFAAAMAWRIGERPTRAELAGAVLVAAGAALVAW